MAYHKPQTFTDIFLIILYDMLLPTCMNAFTQGIRLRTRGAHTLDIQSLLCQGFGLPSLLWVSLTMNFPTQVELCLC